MPISLSLRKERRDRRRREWLLANGPCKGCGSWQALEVDHIEPGTKRFTVNFERGRKANEAELAKCQVLCHDCHAIKTKAERKVPVHDHGTRAMYRQKGCRCDECRAWKRRTVAAWRAGRKAA